MLLCGVDEAGRGCSLGSLIVAAIIMDSEELNKIKVKDSKKISSKRRRSILEKELQEKALEISIVELTAEEINKYHDEGLTMNKMEVIAFTRALNNLELIPDEIYLDAADILEFRFKNNIMKNYKHSDKDIKIISEHKADDNYPIVSAASILAKTKRDSIMKKIAPVSGYGDKKTQEWLKNYYIENEKFPDESRYFWKTLDNIKRKI